MAKEFTVIHTLDESVRVQRGSVVLLEYHYAPDVPQYESPKPYIDPLATPLGDVVTLDRPHDHLWHRGLYFGWAHVNDNNFWGGPTYVRGEGYRGLDNNGSQVHEAWERLERSDDGVWMVERLAWYSFGGERWIDERRTLRVHPLASENELLLTVVTELTPHGDQGPFVFGSPTTNGRPNAGYSGLTLRMQRSMNDGRIVLSTGQEGPDVMGQRGAWLHFAGRLDTTNQPVCVATFDHPANPRHPTKFFVRNNPFGVINPAFCFDEEYVLEKGETLTLRYGVWVRRGEEDLARVAQVYRGWAEGA